MARHCQGGARATIPTLWNRTSKASPLGTMRLVTSLSRAFSSLVGMSGLARAVGSASRTRASLLVWVRGSHSENEQVVTVEAFLLLIENGLCPCHPQRSRTAPGIRRRSAVDRFESYQSLLPFRSPLTAVRGGQLLEAGRFAVTWSIVTRILVGSGLRHPLLRRQRGALTATIRRSTHWGLPARGDSLLPDQAYDEPNEPQYRVEVSGRCLMSALSFSLPVSHRVAGWLPPPSRR